jgi:hypothetical protein
MAFFGIFLCSYSLDRFRTITNALEDFERYEADFKQKWGDPPSPDRPTSN